MADRVIEYQAKYLWAICKAVMNGRQKYVNSDFEPVKNYWIALAEKNKMMLLEQGFILTDKEETKPN
jgi:hypothetical protein